MRVSQRVSYRGKRVCLAQHVPRGNPRVQRATGMREKGYALTLLFALVVIYRTDDKALFHYLARSHTHIHIDIYIYKHAYIK